MKLHELSPVAGSTFEGKRKGRGIASGNGKTGVVVTRARRPVPAARSASVSKAARCLCPAVSPSAALTTSSPSP